jgi:hypothetical protein
MLVTGNQLRAARALAEVDQQWVADRARVSVNTIRNMEARGKNAITSGAEMLRWVQSALESAGVEFTNGMQSGVRLRRKPVRPFNRAERASVVWIGRPSFVGNEFQFGQRVTDFFTFEEAVRHYMTILPAAERPYAKITTESGEQWFLTDILEIYEDPPA